MGIKRVLLVILVFILLSSTVCAVGFEWALGFPKKEMTINLMEWARTGKVYFHIMEDGRYNYHCYDGEAAGCKESGREELPVIAIKANGVFDGPYQCGGTHSDGCQMYLQTRLNYNGETCWQSTISPRDKGTNPFDYDFYAIADEVLFWETHANLWCYKGSNDRCEDRIAFSFSRAPVVTTGFESVFPKDGIKAIGPVSDLIPSALLPDNDTIYVGAYTKQYGDILFWFGPAESEPTDPLKRETNDYFDYINYCADLNHNNVCDYIDAEPCYDRGADWYGDPDNDDWVRGVCCGADPVQLKTDTGLDSTNCTNKLYGGKAYCGINLNGNYEWAPLNDIGAVHELLSCPGYSTVSNGEKYTVCKPGDTDAKFFTIDSIIGTHGYLCSAGELFECRGDGASYSWNQDFVADPGVSTNDLVGSGGCPPKIAAYWPLDDGAAKDSIDTHDGAIAGGSSATGKIGGAIHLEIGNKITLPASVPVEGNQFTVEAWVRPSETAGLRKIIEKEGSFRIAIDDEILVGALHTNQPMGDFGSRRIVANVWHHVALVYDGDKVSLYLDGTAVTDSTHSGNIVWSDKPIIIGGNFVGDIDEVAIYGRALRSSLIKRHTKMPAGYCQGTGAGLAANYYCAGDAAWATDLDVKDESSCNNAGFVWTGNLCCSEDDDINEYYNDHDTPPADLAKVANGGQTVSAHAGAQVSSSQIILTNKGQFATIKGPAKLVVETYSAESPSDIGVCPPLGNPETVVVSPWEQKTIKVLSIGQSGDPCRYRHKIITAEPFLALGGCWEKEFVPIGHFADSSNILNYHGHFYSCGLASTAPELQIQDTQKGGSLVTPASLTCSDIKLNARGAGTHVVCNPGGKWQFTNNSVATTSSEVVWNIAGTNASQYGCCGEDQCWTGYECVNVGKYYTDAVSGKSYFCKE